MKKLFLFFSMLLAMILLCACNSDDEKPDEVLRPGDYVTIYANGSHETRAVYEPMAYQDFPEWIKSIIDGKEKPYILYLRIFQGEKDGEAIYLTCSEMDDIIGTFYYRNGERFYPETDYATFFSETSNWKLIYYYDYKIANNL